MSNIKTFSSKEEIHQQACEWVSRIDRGLSAEEQKDIASWCQQSDVHRAMLFEIAELWDHLSSLNELSGLFPLREKEPAQRNLFSETTRWAVAASFAMAIVLGGTWLANQHGLVDHTLAEHQMNQSDTIETIIGQQKPVSLPDGSVVHLNTNSQINIDFSENQRNIELVRGEAHFDVAHDEQRPFIVQAGENKVTAVGTAFNIQLENEGHFELLVTEGKVLVQDVAQVTMTDEHPLEQQGLLMVSGEKAVISTQASEPVNIPLDQVQKDLAWQQGMLVFQGESLSEALHEVSRYTSISFTISDEQIKQRRVAGYFKAGDIDGLLFALKNNFGIEHVKQANNRIELRSAEQI